MELLAQEQRAKAKAEKLDSKRKISKVWFSLGHLMSLQHRSIWDSAHRLKTTAVEIIEALMARVDNYLMTLHLLIPV
jgi:hypothetical protein